MKQMIDLFYRETKKLPIGIFEGMPTIEQFLSETCSCKSVLPFLDFSSTPSKNNHGFLDYWYFDIREKIQFHSLRPAHPAIVVAALSVAVEESGATNAKWNVSYINEQNKAQPCIYFIKAGDYVKIGYAKNVRKRIDSLQTGNPVRLELLLSFPGNMEDEKNIHNKFSHLLAPAGNEWFRLTEEILYFIESIGG